MSHADPLLSMPAAPSRPSRQPHRIALLNPNTSTHSTQQMMASALTVLPPGVRLEGRNVRAGQPIIADPAALAQAALAVDACGAALAEEGFDGIIVAAFGDPGVPALRQRLVLPVTGLGEAGIAEAARGGLPYAIVTITPELQDSLLAAAHAAAPPGQLVGIRYTRGPLQEVMRSPCSQHDALLAFEEPLQVDVEDLRPTIHGLLGLLVEIVKRQLLYRVDPGSPGGLLGWRRFRRGVGGRLRGRCSERFLSPKSCVSYSLNTCSLQYSKFIFHSTIRVSHSSLPPCSLPWPVVY